MSPYWTLVLLSSFLLRFSGAAPLPLPQGPDFKGLDPNNKPGRFVDRILCPKNVVGEYTRNKSFCHRAHMGWHKISEAVDKMFGGTGEFDRERYKVHFDGLRS